MRTTAGRRGLDSISRGPVDAHETRAVTEQEPTRISSIASFRFTVLGGPGLRCPIAVPATALAVPDGRPSCANLSSRVGSRAALAPGQTALGTGPVTSGDSGTRPITRSEGAQARNEAVATQATFGRVTLAGTNLVRATGAGSFVSPSSIKG